MVNTNQCYACDSRLKDGCGDPFNAHSMTDMEKTTVSGGGICTVCFIRIMFILMSMSINIFSIPENKICIKRW
jgi:hypothetical protein